MEAISLVRPIKLSVAVFQSGVFLLQVDGAVRRLLVDLDHLVLHLGSGLLSKVGSLLFHACVVQSQLGV